MKTDPFTSTVLPEQYQIGASYGRWRVVGAIHWAAKRRLVPCQCECGTRAEVSVYDLRDGRTGGCISCLRSQNGSLGLSRMREYASWRMMFRRCYEPTHDSYKYYGARGITVHASWHHNFSAFLADVGPKPSPKHTLDRIDVNGNYEPGNVKWSTPLEQTRNRRKRPPTQNQLLLAKLGISRHTLRKYLNLGVAAEDIPSVMSICHCSACGAAGHQARSCTSKDERT